MAGTLLLLATLLLIPASLNADGGLPDDERAVVLAGRHLLRSMGSPALAEAVTSRSIRSDAYWRGVFAAAGEPDLYEEVADTLRQAVAGVPLVGGRTAEPDVYARAIYGGLGRMPMAPLSGAGPAERRAVNDFALNELSGFSAAVEADPSAAPAAARRLAPAAKAAFGSVAIADGFMRLAKEIALNTDKPFGLMEAKDRLNEYLHAFGLHVVIDAAELKRGKTEVASYIILSKRSFTILGKPFTIYEARPTLLSRSTAALGHAEVEPGYLFVFAHQVDQECEAGLSFARGKPAAEVWAAESGGPLGTLSPEGRADVEQAVRERIIAATSLDRERYRALLINTIGRHEGFHMYTQSALENAFRRGRRDLSSVARLHETGAYLYQLEASDPRFTHMDLFMLLMMASEGAPRFPANTDGARAAMSAVQGYLTRVSFWDPVGNRPVEPGIAALFLLEPAEIQKAAGQARWEFSAGFRD